MHIKVHRLNHQSFYAFLWHRWIPGPFSVPFSAIFCHFLSHFLPFSAFLGGFWVQLLGSLSPTSDLPGRWLVHENEHQLWFDWWPWWLPVQHRNRPDGAYWSSGDHVIESSGDEGPSQVRSEPLCWHEMLALFSDRARNSLGTVVEQLFLWEQLWEQLFLYSEQLFLCSEFGALNNAIALIANRWYPFVHKTGLILLHDLLFCMICMICCFVLIDFTWSPAGRIWCSSRHWRILISYWRILISYWRILISIEESWFPIEESWFPIEESWFQ